MTDSSLKSFIKQKYLILARSSSLMAAAAAFHPHLLELWTVSQTKHASQTSRRRYI